MSAKKFRFVSPGVKINEIDNTELPQVPGDVGPVFIGRARKGPFMKPITVSSKEELFEIFGTPVSGNGAAGDVWRAGDVQAPTYGMYGAAAHLANSNVCTFIRLGGDEHPDRTDDVGQAGWDTDVDTFDPGATSGKDGGAFGLFVMKATMDSIITGPTGTIYTPIGAPGQDDVTVTGTPTGVRTLSIRVLSTEDTDLFEYSLNGEDYTGSLAGAMDPGTDIPGTGLKFVCGNALGHTVGDVWDVVGDFGKLLHAATIYVNDGSLALDGTSFDGTTPVAGNAVFVETVGNDFAFDLRLYDHTNDLTDVDAYDKKVRINFNDSSTKYVRKVLNTDPTLTNNSITASADRLDYWLGETYRSALYEEFGSSSAGSHVGVLLKIENTASAGSDHKFPMVVSKTGWVFGQDMSSDGPGVYGGAAGEYDPTTMPKLFRLHCLESGEWAQANVKISIDNIQYSTSTADPYGKFDVVVRSASDIDRRPVVLERFARCDLNPASTDYVGRKIGTRYLVWDDTERRYKRYGEYENRSQYIRVEVANIVANGSADSSLLPWGFYGETVFESATVTTGSIDLVTGNEFVRGSGVDVADRFIAFGTSATTDDIDTDGIYARFTISEPKLRLRETSSEEDVTMARDCFWGVRTTKFGVVKNDPDYMDLVRCHSFMQKDKSGDDTGMDYAYMFTLDDVCYQVASPTPYMITYSAEYVEGSYVSGRSITAGFETDGAGTYTPVSPDYKLLIDSGFARFTMALSGGADGRNIREKDAFRNTIFSGVTSVEDQVNNAPFYTILKALEICTQKERLQMDRLSVPGITNSVIINKIINIAEQRSDTFAICDTEGQYIPAHENYDDEEDRIGSRQEVVNWMIDTDFNTSYAGFWGNWVKITDRWNNNSYVWIPPSVVAAGLISYSQNAGNVWSAPAGFNRANLSFGHCGLNVVDVLFDWNDVDGGDKDILFENHVNPIISYTDGIICMGDLTTLRSTSVLKSVGTRLLVNYIKKTVSFYAKRVLFDQNIMVTWNRFISDVDPFLRDINVGGGLADYKVVFDSSTTTQDLVDRNIMYAKIYLAPTEPGKFFGIDMILTRQGAEFAD